MRSGEADGNQQVLDLLLLWQQGPVADQVGSARGYFNVSLVLHESFRRHIPLAVMGIHGVGAHADRVSGHDQPAAVVFSYHIFADQAAGFPDVELMRPVAVVGKLILCQTPP